MMKRIYDKNPISFSLIWIGLYVIAMNIAMQVCGGFDDLPSKTIPQMLVPVLCGAVLAAAATWWILRHGMASQFGLCRFRGNIHSFLWFLPLILLSCINLKNGLSFPASLPLSLLMMANLMLGGYIEEIIFRGFLFRSMAKENLKSAILVSAITFGVGHIVNIFNTADTMGVLLQIAYAIAIGFLYTVIVYRGGSLWPCIASHIFVNGSSVFAPDNGPFSDMVASVFRSASPILPQVCSAVWIILLAGSYALWLWKRTNNNTAP